MNIMRKITIRFSPIGFGVGLGFFGAIILAATWPPLWLILGGMSAALLASGKRLVELTKKLPANFDVNFLCGVLVVPAICTAMFYGYFIFCGLRVAVS